MPETLLTRVMVVDDSAVIRGMVSRILESVSGIQVVTSAQNGELALSQYDRYLPDVVIMDIEMPVMDGITALKALIGRHPDAKVVMCSTLTMQNAEISLRAMSLGAVDYIPKPTSTTEVNSSSEFREKLISLAKSFAKPHKGPLPEPAERPSLQAQADMPERTKFILPPPGTPIQLRPEPLMTWRPRILAVGSSTGGPQALFEFFKPLKNLKTIPVVVTQHMPPTFTKILAQHINAHTGINTVEAEDGMPLLPGRIHVAHGGRHMLVRKDEQGHLCLGLNDGPPENFCKPAVDPMLRSLIPLYARDILTVILTGMGADGMLGSKAIIEAGGFVAAQDQASSIVWGMPGAVATQGLCCKVLPPRELGEWVGKKVL